MIRLLPISLLLLLLPVTATLAQPVPERTLLIEITGLSQEELAERLSAYDSYSREHLVSFVRQRALVIASHEEVAAFRRDGLNVTVLMEDDDTLRLYRRALYGESMVISPVYHTYERVLEIGDSLIAANPRIIHRMRIGQTTQGGRDIFAFRISNDAARVQDKPGILFNGATHSDELMGVQITVALMKELVGGYGTDPRVTGWVDSNEIYVVPVVNVDGHHVVTSSIDPRWRKNTRVLNDEGILHRYPEGVDLNRNYDFNWAHGGSDDPMNVRYRGEYPFSEAENRAMRNLLEQKRFILSATYHSQGEVIYYPWTWRGRPAPDDALITEIVSEVASRITTMAGDGTYRFEPGAGTVGQSYPWMYGRYGTIDMIIETGLGAQFFPPEEVPGIREANLHGARHILDRAAGPGLTGHVTSAETGEPVEAVVWFPAIDTEEVDRRMTEPQFGRFFRLLQPGTYIVMFLKEGYRPAIHTVEVGPEGWTTLDVALSRQSDTAERM